MEYYTYYFNFCWCIVYTISILGVCNIYIRGLDDLSVPYELYDLVLRACQPILKIVISPEDESSLLLKLCAVCFVPSDRGNSSDTCQ
jgi:hypothetical protein